MSRPLFASASPDSCLAPLHAGQPGWDPVMWTRLLNLVHALRQPLAGVAEAGGLGDACCAQLVARLVALLGSLASARPPVPTAGEDHLAGPPPPEQNLLDCWQLAFRVCTGPALKPLAAEAVAHSAAGQQLQCSCAALLVQQAEASQRRGQQQGRRGQQQGQQGQQGQQEGPSQLWAEDLLLAQLTTCAMVLGLASDTHCDGLQGLPEATDRQPLTRDAAAQCDAAVGAAWTALDALPAAAQLLSAAAASRVCLAENVLLPSVLKAWLANTGERLHAPAGAHAQLGMAAVALALHAVAQHTPPCLMHTRAARLSPCLQPACCRSWFASALCQNGSMLAQRACSRAGRSGCAAQSGCRRRCQRQCKLQSWRSWWPTAVWLPHKFAAAGHWQRGQRSAQPMASACWSVPPPWPPPPAKQRWRGGVRGRQGATAPALRRSLFRS